VETLEAADFNFVSYRLGDFLKVKHGKSQKEVLNDSGPYPVIGSGGEFGRASEFIHNKPSVLIGRKGTIDRPLFMDSPFWVVDTMFYTEILEGFDPKFIFYLFQSIDWRSKNEASGVPSLSGKIVEAIEVLIPDYKTQKAIAMALSDIDELIVTLKFELNKKVNLLTSINQRIFVENGISGLNFEFLNFGEICSITTGKKNVNQGSLQGKYPFFTCSVHNTWSDSYSFDSEAILIAGNGDVGNLHYYNGKFEAYQRTYVSTDFKLNPRYIWFYLNHSLVKNLGLNKVGSTIPYILKSQLTDFKIPVPINKTFINKIVETLEAFTLEIELLNDEIAKYECVKQGMAHDLLTGKVRLV
jgi:type I restriction enzyme S subunit